MRWSSFARRKPPDETDPEPIDWFRSASPASDIGVVIVRHKPLHQRTDVLAAGAAMSVLVFLGTGGYALTRMDNAVPRGDRPSPSMASPRVDGSVGARPAPWVPPEPSPPNEPSETTSVPTVSTGRPIAGVLRPPAAASTKTSRTPSTTPPMTTATTTPTTTSSSAARSGSGRFTGVIAAINGDMWTFALWDDTTMTMRVTANTQLTPRAELLPRPQFMVGQTVAVFWQSIGDVTIANRIFGIS